MSSSFAMRVHALALMRWLTLAIPAVQGSAAWGRSPLQPDHIDGVQEDGFPVTIDGKAVEHIPRKVVNETPGEILWRFAPSQPGGVSFSINASHVSIPLNTHLQATYARNYSCLGEFESGLSNLFFVSNPISILSSKTKLVLSEKMFTLSYQGDGWSNRSAVHDRTLYF